MWKRKRNIYSEEGRQKDGKWQKTERERNK
jgi:hypothetical protein